MRNLALYWVAVPAVLWFAAVCYRNALRIVRQDAKEAAALRLADQSPSFARALYTVKELKGGLPAVAPWHRPENGGPA